MPARKNRRLEEQVRAKGSALHPERGPGRMDNLSESVSARFNRFWGLIPALRSPPLAGFTAG